MRLDESPLVEQCIQSTNTCNRSFNNRDIQVFPILAMLVLSYSDEKDNLLNQ